MRKSFEYLLSGDLISLKTNEGNLACTSVESEPGFISSTHTLSLNLFENGNEEKKNSDFYKYCLFSIQVLDFSSDEESLVQVKFGSIVQLYSHPLGYILCGGKDGNGDYSICLKNLDVVLPSYLESQWIVSSKYKLRQNGEVVRNQDYVVFKNVNDSEQTIEINSGVVMNSLFAKENLGWCVDIYQNHQISPSKNLRFGDYISILHLESESELICRGNEINVPHGRMGIICRDNFIDRNPSSFGVYYRKVLDNDSPQPIKDLIGPVGLNVWQILPSTNLKFVGLTNNSPCILQHVSTGMYLSVKNVNENNEKSDKNSNDFSGKNKFQLDSPRPDEIFTFDWKIEMTFVLDESCEFLFEMVDRPTQFYETKENETNNNTNNTNNNVDESIPAINKFEYPIFLENHVFLRHRLTKCYIKSNGKTIIDPNLSIEKKIEIMTNGAWEFQNDCLAIAMRNSHVSESIQVKHVHLNVVKSLLVNNRFTPILNYSLFGLQLSGVHTSSLRKCGPVLSFLINRCVEYCNWMQGNRDFETSHNNAEKNLSSKNKNLVANLVKDNNENNNINEEKMGNNNAPNEDKDSDDYDDDDDDDDDEDDDDEDEKNIQGFYNKLLSKIKRFRKKKKISHHHHNTFDVDTLCQVSRDEIELRQCVASNTRLVDLILHLANVIYLLLHSHSQEQVMTKKKNEFRKKHRERRNNGTNSRLIKNKNNSQKVLDDIYVDDDDNEIIEDENGIEEYNDDNDDVVDVLGEDDFEDFDEMIRSDNENDILLNEDNLIKCEILDDDFVSLLSSCAEKLLNCASVCIERNIAAQVRLLSSPDLIAFWIQMYMSGWKPPIEKVLKTSDTYGNRLRSFGVGAGHFSIIDPAEFFLVIRTVIDSHTIGSHDEFATNSLHLVTCLFTASESFRTRSLDKVMYAVLQVFDYNKSKASQENDKTSKCLWFKIVEGTADYTVVPDCGELGNYPRIKLNSRLDNELSELIQFFLLYFPENDQHASFDHLLSVSSAIKLAEDLGLAGPTLCLSVLQLTNKSLKDVVKWWWLNSKYFLSMSLYRINASALREVMEVVDKVLIQIQEIKTARSQSRNPQFTSRIQALVNAARNAFSGKTLSSGDGNPTVQDIYEETQQIVKQLQTSRTNKFIFEIENPVVDSNIDINNKDILLMDSDDESFEEEDKFIKDVKRKQGEDDNVTITDEDEMLIEGYSEESDDEREKKEEKLIEEAAQGKISGVNWENNWDDDEKATLNSKGFKSRLSNGNADFSEESSEDGNEVDINENGIRLSILNQNNLESSTRNISLHNEPTDHYSAIEQWEKDNLPSPDRREESLSFGGRLSPIQNQNRQSESRLIEQSYQTKKTQKSQQNRFSKQFEQIRNTLTGSHYDDGAGIVMPGILSYNRENNDDLVPFETGDISWELVFSHDFKDAKWLRESIFNLNSICDPENPFVQKLVSDLLPPDMIMNLMQSPRVRLKYKTLVIDLLSKGHLRRWGVFPVFIMTSMSVSGAGKLFVGLDSASGSYIDRIFPVSDVFSDASSKYSLVRGARLRRALRDYFHTTLSRMSFSVSNKVKEMEYNTAVLKIIKEMLQRGFFVHKTSKYKPSGTSKQKKKPFLKFNLGKKKGTMDTPDEIQEMIMTRLYVMEPPHRSSSSSSEFSSISNQNAKLSMKALGKVETKNNNNLEEIDTAFVQMIDAVVDVLQETAQITTLYRVEIIARLNLSSSANTTNNTGVGANAKTNKQEQSAHQNSKWLDNSSKQDLKFAKSLLSIFSATPVSLGPSIISVQRKAHKLMYEQLNEADFVTKRLSNVCLFPLTEITLKTRQLSGLGAHLVHNISYLCDKLKDSSDLLLKQYLVEEIGLIFDKINDIFLTFTLISGSDISLDEEETRKKNKERKEGREIQAGWIDLDHFKSQSHYSIDEYVETYFLQSFSVELAHFVLKYQSRWFERDKFDAIVSEQLVRFLASCGHNSYTVSVSLFVRMKDFVLQYWREDESVSLLLEQFCFHHCDFSSDELKKLLDDVLTDIDVPINGEVDFDSLCKSSNRLLPILVSLLDFIKLEDIPLILPEQNNIAINNENQDAEKNVKMSNDFFDAQNNDDNNYEMPEDALGGEKKVSDAQLIDTLLFVLTTFGKKIEGKLTKINPHSGLPLTEKEIEKGVPFQEHIYVDCTAPLFIFVFKALWAFLSNPEVAQTLRAEVKLALSHVWNVDQLSLLLRNRFCPVNVRVIILKIYLSLHSFKEYALIDRCLLKNLDQHPQQFNLLKIENKREKSIEVINENKDLLTKMKINERDSDDEVSENDAFLERKQAEQSGEIKVRRSQRFSGVEEFQKEVLLQLQLSEVVPTFTSPAPLDDSFLNFNDIEDAKQKQQNILNESEEELISVPALTDYLGDALFVVGKLCIYHFLMLYRINERKVAFNTRRKEIDETTSKIVKKYLRTNDLRNSSAFSFNFKETMNFYRVYDLFIDDNDPPPPPFMTIPIIYSVITYCTFLTKYCNTSVGYNKHVHHTIASHLIWICVFAIKMIEDIEISHGFSLNDLHLMRFRDGKDKLLNFIDILLSWRQQSRKYSEILARYGGTHHFHFSTKNNIKNNKKKSNSNLLTNIDKNYEKEINFMKSSILFSEMSRLIVRLSRKLVEYNGNSSTEILASSRINSNLLSTSESIGLKSLFVYLGNTAEPNRATYMLVSLTNSLFSNFDSRLSSSHEEESNSVLKRLRKLQFALSRLGVVSMAVNIINRFTEALADREKSSSPSTIKNNNKIKGRRSSLVDSFKPVIEKDDMCEEIITMAIQLTCNLMSLGNKPIQNEVLKLAGYDVVTKIYSKTGNSLLVSILSAMSRCLSNSLEIVIMPEQFELLECIFRFLSFLTQQNDNGQNFVRDQERPESVNLVSSSAKAIDFLLRYMSLKMINNNGESFKISADFNWTKDFKKPFSPTFYSSVSSDTISMMMNVISSGCAALKDMCQGPCTLNQLSAVPALREIPNLLDIIGSYLGTPAVFNKRFNSSKNSQILKTIKKDNQNTSVKNNKKDVDGTGVLRKVQEMFVTSSRNLQAFVIPSQDPSDMQLRESLNHCEVSVVRFLNSLIEGVSQNRITTIGSLLDESTIFDNLTRCYKNMYTGNSQNRATQKRLVVSYLSLLLTMADAQEMAEGISTRYDNVKMWQKKCAEEGHDMSTFIASVEIIDKNGNVDRVYFPVPDFAVQFWTYPEVQMAKDQLMQEVNRSSPDEKISDFYIRFIGLISVMNRQQLLKRLLSPVIHALFGGKSFISKELLSIIPSQRFFLLLLTLFINGYYSNQSYDTDDTMEGDPSASEFFSLQIWQELVSPHSNFTVIIYLLKVLHLTLCCSLVIRKLINSRALDSVGDMIDDVQDVSSHYFRTISFKILKALIASPATIFQVLMSSSWTICLCGLSYLGLKIGVGFYAGCILDAIPQISYMSFLFTAVQKNVIRISLTMLLAFIILYMFSVVTFFYFPDQYNFNGHTSCNKDVLGCFKLHIDYGINNPMTWNTVGDVGYINPTFHPFTVWIQDEYYTNLAAKIFGSIYSFIFQLLMNQVLQAIISGYIIDTFGSMRDEHEFIENDKRDMCFICSIQRDVFEKNSVSFTKHIKEEHNVWKYVWFKLHLDRVGPKTMSGPEYHSKPLFNNDQFPEVDSNKSINVSPAPNRSEER